MKYFIMFSYFLFCISINSCVSFGLQDEVVVERSKKERPEWADQSINVLREESLSSFVTFTREKQSNLSLSIKQIEELAISFTERLLIEKQLLQLRQVMKEPTLESQFTGHLLKVIRSKGKELIKVKDIYYEKVKISSEDQNGKKVETFAYKTFALIEIPKKMQDEIVLATMEEFK